MAATATEVVAAIARLRDALRRPHDPIRAANTLARVIAEWRTHASDARRDAIMQISMHSGFSIPLLDASIDALLAPFTPDALERVAQTTARRREFLAFITAGNVPGAGLHEVALALIAGASVLIKPASREPHFFEYLARSIRADDADLGAQIEVLHWSRNERDLTCALTREADRTIAYGDDATLAAIGSPNLIGFGSRISGAVVTRTALDDGEIQSLAATLARDVTIFEQLGCLSPHHIFVEDDSHVGSGAREFADRMGAALESFAHLLPSPELTSLEDRAALRRVREIARWRAAAGENVAVIAGDRLSWAAIFDCDAGFSLSPGFRTVWVSPYRSRADLRARLLPAAGRIEAIEIAGRAESFAADFAKIGVNYFAPPGAIQSPPLVWRHGGGAFLDSIIRSDAPR